MNAFPLALRRRGALRHSPRDALLVALAAGHGLLLVVVPAAPVVAVGMWWNSNTIAHHFLHTPFFRSRLLNGLFSCYLTVLLGIPQALWRQRHLAHHAEVPWRLRLTGQLLLETGLVLTLWALLLVWQPQFFLMAYLPGYAAGLVLCWLQGHYEHVRGTVSHHGRLYNALFFNDGYHVEHHDRPGRHWTQLPRHARRDVPLSPWPAVLRWLEVFSLEGLERLVVRSPFLQRFMLAVHERAFRRLLPEVGTVRRAGIVGGGLFPRTALILQRLLPDARLVVIDASVANLETARPFVGDGVAFVNEVYDPGRHGDFDLLVIPLAYVGDRRRFYHDPPGPAFLVHDWLWRSSCRGEIVSLLLLKRLNLVKR